LIEDGSMLRMSTVIDPGSSINVPEFAEFKSKSNWSALDVFTVLAVCKVFTVFKGSVVACDVLQAGF